MTPPELKAVLDAGERMRAWCSNMEKRDAWDKLSESLASPDTGKLLELLRECRVFLVSAMTNAFHYETAIVLCDKINAALPPAKETTITDSN